MIYEQAWAFWGTIDEDAICRNLSACSLAASCSIITYDASRVPGHFVEKLDEISNVKPVQLTPISNYNQMIRMVLHAKKLHMLKFDTDSPVVEQLPFVVGHKIKDTHVLVRNDDYPIYHGMAYLGAAYAALKDIGMIKPDDLK